MESPTRMGFKEEVWQLLVREKNASLNIVDKHCDTPLTLAVRLHRSEMIRWILTTTRDVDMKLKDPFHLYCEEGTLDEKTFRCFLSRSKIYEKRSVNRGRFDGKTFLHCLLNNVLMCRDPVKMIPFIIMLKEEGTDLSKQDKSGHTPLMIAVHFSFPLSVFNTLTPCPSRQCKSGPLSLRDCDGRTALHLALRRWAQKNGRSKKEVDELREIIRFLSPKTKLTEKEEREMPLPTFK